MCVWGGAHRRLTGDALFSCVCMPLIESEASFQKRGVCRGGGGVVLTPSNLCHIKTLCVVADTV